MNQKTISAVPGSDRRVETLFEEQVLRHAERIAVCAVEGEWTYSELNSRANQLARYLQSLGVQRNRPVGVCLNRSLWNLAAILAIIKSGGCYVPLDPAYPAARLESMIADAAIALLITDSSIPHAFSRVITRVTIDRIENLIEPFSSANLENSCQIEDLIYIIYTSGTSGDPRGVMVAHRGVARLFVSLKPHLTFSEQDVWTGLHSTSFGFSVWEIFGALLHGGRLVIVPSEVASSPVKLCELVEKERVTVLSLTPTAFRLYESADRASGRTTTPLRVISLSGEPLNEISLRRWIDRRGDQRPQIFNLYAMTETSGPIAVQRITDSVTDQSRGCATGAPLYDVTVQIVDSHLKPVGNGVSGELCIAGDMVAIGYCNHPELSLREFLPDPDSNVGQAVHFYRTGDIARALPDGRIELLGRNDTQVKRHGYRINLAEIEAQIASFSQIREVVVVHHNDVSDGSDLVAYLVLWGIRELEVASLDQQLRHRLPNYMIPSRYVVLAELPVSINGKLDYRRLPPPADASITSENLRNHDPTEIARLLTSVWKVVLGKEPKPNVNYFEMGADSFAIARVHEIVRKDLPNVELISFYIHPTISAFVQFLSKKTPREKSIAGSS